MYLQNLLTNTQDNQRIYLLCADTQKGCAVPAGVLKNSLARVIEVRFPQGFVVSESDYSALIG